MEVTGGEISTYRCLVYVTQTMEYRWSFHPLSQWTFIYTLYAALPAIIARPTRSAGYIKWLTFQAPLPKV